VDPIGRPEVTNEPVTSEARDLLQRARFLEEMGCARHDLELHFARKELHGSAIELDDHRVIAPDDQQYRLVHQSEGLTREVRSTAA
jgi:hypothetical protein